MGGEGGIPESQRRKAAGGERATSVSPWLHANDDKS